MGSEIIFSLVGGLGLLIYGIHLMGLGLQKFAGSRMKEILARVISNRFKGVLVGTGVTAVIQSSSATSVMVVGLVSAGLMTLTQAIPVIFGANIGTTMTGQLIAFKLTKYALPIVAAGAGMFFFSKKEKTKDLGEGILGFGILFLGLNLMTGATAFLKGYPWVSDMFVSFSHNPLLGVLAGFILTFMIQSSSATIGILIALAVSGVVNLEAAIPIMMGDNIGTCTTALLASISSTFQAKRAALSHFMFNIFGTILGLLMLPLYMKFIPLTSSDIARQVANSHTFFNILNVIIFLPAIPLFVKILKKIIPTKEAEEQGAIYLEKKLLKTPSIAIKSATREIVRMLEMAKTMIGNIMGDFFQNKLDTPKKVVKMEDIVDNLQTEITKYLIELTQEELNKNDSEKIPALIHVVNDIERIGDHAVNLVELTRRKVRNNLPFSAAAMKEMKEIYKFVSEMMDETGDILKNDSKHPRADKIYELEKKINHLTVKFRNAHVERLESGKCDMRSGILFIDYLMNFEKIGDHLTNVADAKTKVLS